MSKILFPTDFSEASEKAFPYAHSFAQFLNRSIEVVHYYHPVMNDLSGVDYNLAKELQDMKTEQMEKFIDRLDLGEVEVKTSVQVGFPIQTIVERSKEDEVSLIIMSTKGEKNALDRWLGSISSEVSVKARCPVILVPSGEHKAELKNVLYATSHESLNEKSVRRLQNLIQQLGAAVHFLYVAPDEVQSENVRNEVIDMLFADGEPNFSFSIHLIEGDDPVEGINQYIKENTIDLVIMYNVTRSFWKGLVHRSTTRQMAFNTQAPLLIMHQKDHD
jgi:nucleotide-binding universal stress UspA family protein